jgi:hypothetical protein
MMGRPDSYAVADPSIRRLCDRVRTGVIAQPMRQVGAFGGGRESVFRPLPNNVTIVTSFGSGENAAGCETR